MGSLVGSDAPYGSNSNQVRRNYSTGSVTYSTRGGGAIGDNETVSPQTIFENNYYDNVSDSFVNNYPKALQPPPPNFNKRRTTPQRSSLGGTS